MKFPHHSFLGVLAVVAGCAYYNGLYNAHQFAKEAVRAERDGRTEEARSLWTLAAHKAGAVAGNYPESEHWDDAVLLQGRALRNTGKCSEAAPPLELAIESSPDRLLRDEARLLAGACLVERGLPDSAIQVLSPLIGRGPIPVLDEARWWRGRASMALGRWEDALVDLDLTRVADSPWDRAEALIRLTRGREAATVLDSVVHLPFQERLWTRVLSVVGEQHRVMASSLVDRLIQKRELTPGQRARLVLADADRWEGVDRAFAAQRFRVAAYVGRQTVEASDAERRLLVDRFQRSTMVDSARVIGTELLERIAAAGDADPAMTMYGARLEWVLAAIDSSGFSYPDVALFRAAELLRDSLRAREVAVWVFSQVTERFPESVLAPKALLARAAMSPADAQRLESDARDRYPMSPYFPLPTGAYAAELIKLEDSLEILFRQVRSEGNNRL